MVSCIEVFLILLKINVVKYQWTYVHRNDQTESYIKGAFGSLFTFVLVEFYSICLI